MKVRKATQIAKMAGICCRRVSRTSVRLFVQAGTVPKRQNEESRKQRHTIARGLKFHDIISVILGETGVQTQLFGLEGRIPYNGDAK